MPNGKSGWDGPLKLDFNMRRFKQELAIEMKGFTPQKTGALRAANRIFDLGDNTLKIANKQTYALAQHDGAVIPPFSMKGLAGKNKPGGGVYKKMMYFAGAGHPFMERKGFTLKAHQWVPKGLDRASHTIGVSWAKASAA